MAEDITSPSPRDNITLTKFSRLLASSCYPAISRRNMDSALAQPGVAADPAPRPLAIANWLLAVAAMVFLMVVVGGITRLTESGLSITEWNPGSGAIPPLTHEQWQHAFALYQQTPELREINGPAGMDLAQYKFIFFWEWVHRLIG